MSRFMSNLVKYMFFQNFIMYPDSTTTQQAKIFKLRKIFINVRCPKWQQEMGNKKPFREIWTAFLELVIGLRVSKNCRFSKPVATSLSQSIRNSKNSYTFICDRTCFSAEKPRADKQSAGLFVWTALSSPSLRFKKERAGDRTLSFEKLSFFKTRCDKFTL